MKRIVSGFLAILMVVSLLPVVAFATEQGEDAGEILLTAEKTTLYVGETIQLKVSFEAEPDSFVLLWNSSDENIATVTQEGTVTACAVGEVTVSVSSEKGREAELTLLVEEPADDTLFENTAPITEPTEGDPESTEDADDSSGPAEPVEQEDTVELQDAVEPEDKEGENPEFAGVAVSEDGGENTETNASTVDNINTSSAYDVYSVLGWIVTYDATHGAKKLSFQKDADNVIFSIGIDDTINSADVNGTILIEYADPGKTHFLDINGNVYDLSRAEGKLLYDIFTTFGLGFASVKITDDYVKSNFGTKRIFSYDGPITYYSDRDLYKSGKNGKGRDIDVNLIYNDNFFNQSSYSYNHDLAKASLKFAFSAFPYENQRKGGEGGAARYAYDFLQKTGFNSIKDYCYDEKPKQHSFACVIGAKYLEETEETLIALAIRGAGYGSEWAGNFTVGNSKYHTGFQKAANKVVKTLTNYIEGNGDINGDIKLWITGYSRAAATANIVAGMLDNGECVLPEKVSLNRNDLFAYTFATPMGVRSSHEPKKERYKNIFNIINPTDFVPKIAPDKWKYQRYGVDYFLPDLSKLRAKNYSKIAAKHKELTGKQYIKPFENFLLNGSTISKQSVFLDRLIKKIANVIGDSDKYVKKGYEEGIVSNCLRNEGLPDKSILGITPVGDAVREDITIEILESGVVGGLLGTGIEFVITGTQAGILYAHTNELEFSHYPENYLAYMEALEGDIDNDFWDGKYKYYIVKCPVDVEVVGPDGIVASIANDTATLSSRDDVEVYVDGNGEKYIYIYDDADYTLNMTATDDGEMDCTVVDYQSGQGKMAQSAFFDIELTKGMEYTAEFAMASDEYAIQGEAGEILPDVAASGDELQNTSVSVNIIGSGIVAGASDLYTPGDTASLYAQAEEGNVFVGWYDADGKLIAYEETYSFSVHEDCELTAVFISTDVKVELDREYLALELNGETASAALTLNVEPAEWAEFTTWTVENVTEQGDVISVAAADGTVTVNSIGVGTAYAVATVSFKGYEFTARCRVDVTDEPVEEQLQGMSGISGVQLSTNTVTTEIYSTDYTQFGVLLLLPQNMEMGAAMTKGNQQKYEKPVDNGVAVESARFVNDIVSQLFDLVVKDDRTLLVVPSDKTQTGNVSRSYSSAVSVTVGGKEFVTEDAVKITVKKTLPKLRVTNIKLNPFYEGNSAEISFSGGKVTGLQMNPAKQSESCGWVELDGTKLRLAENAPTRGSGKIYLLANVEGCTKQIDVVASVSLAYAVPQVKLSSTQITLQENAQGSKGVQLKLQNKNSKQSFGDLGITEVVPPPRLPGG